MQELLQNGVSTFLVGGWVRDRLLGKDPKDHDFVVVGATPELMLSLGFTKVGADFPVFLNTNGDEFALARTERKTGPGFLGFECDFNPTISLVDDLKRRDLTVNSMARKVIGWNDIGHAKLSDEIIDPFNGQDDLKDEILRHTSAAFAEDPVRVMRIARFASRFPSWIIAHETSQLMVSMVQSGELDSLVAERVWLELTKTIVEPAPQRFFDVLASVGALERIMPEMEQVRANCMIWERSIKAPRPLNKVELLASIFSDINVRKIRDGLFSRIKAEKVVTSLTEQIVDIRNVGRSGLSDAETIHNLLKRCNIFQEGIEVLQQLSRVGIILNEHATTHVINKMIIGHMVSHDVNFASLTIQEKAVLKGPRIGEAIAAIRIAKIAEALS